jgi:exopolysaccharide production protein ExoQ
MNPSPRQHEIRDAALQLLGSARFGRAITIAIVATAYLAFTLKATMGWAGLIAIVASLVALSAASLTVRRRELEWRGILPISLLAFLGWSAISVFWADYQWASLGSIFYQLSFAFLGIYVALTRDMIQIVRAFGDVFRVVLSIGLALEVLSGLLVDVPFTFLRIAGNLGLGGPIQGLMGSRNQLGLVAMIALITFFVEWRTHSVQRPFAIASLALAGLTLLFTHSPVAFGVFAIAVIAALALIGLRRTDPATRRVGQFALLGAVVVTAIVAVLSRGRVVEVLNAGSEFEFRLSLWRTIASVTPADTLQGYGWIGYWRTSLPPYSAISGYPVNHQSALNAYVDVWMQLGLVGLCAFVAFAGLAFVRSWLLASSKRSIVYLWPALVLLVLLLVSTAESSILVEFGWFTLVICALKASQDLSWRSRLPEELAPPADSY